MERQVNGRNVQTKTTAASGTTTASRTTRVSGTVGTSKARTVSGTTASKTSGTRATTARTTATKASGTRATTTRTTTSRTAASRAISAERRRRVNRIKKIILGFVLVAILTPTVSCVCVSVQNNSLKGLLRDMETERDALSQVIEALRLQLNEKRNSNSNSEQSGNQETYEEVTNPQEGLVGEDVHYEINENNTRKVYLTFDDGPSENTERILDILDLYGVKATFFVTGEDALNHPERYKAIVDAGHTIGMHSYSHRYSEIYASEDEFGSDLLKLQEFIEQTTGVIPMYYRFPGGSSNTVSELPMSVFCDYLTENGITYFDWNKSSKDASSTMCSVEEIVYNCTADLESYYTAIILLHDASNKTSTVDALPEILETISSMEYTEILPITEETVVVHH